MESSERKRTRWAAIISVAIHIGVFCALTREAGFESSSKTKPVQISFIATDNTSEKAPGNAATKGPTSPAPVPPPAESDTHLAQQVLRRSGKTASRRKIQNATNSEKNNLPSKEKMSTPAGDGAVPVIVRDNTSPAAASNRITAPPKIRARMEFSDFEKFSGADAVSARKQLSRQSQKKRRLKNAFAPHSKALSDALRNRRSVLIGANVLPLERKADLVAQYLREIHKVLAPRFSSFLNTLDSPSELMHKKVQNSPLKYNPFYVPPPETERQLTLRGPMSDLSITAVTEFEILPGGELAAVRLVRSSTHAVFDSAAVSTVLHSAPFAPPPAPLLSKDNRSYLQWTFQRDWKKNTWAQGHVYLIGPDKSPETDTGKHQ